EVYNVSSATGSGTGELLDAIVSHFPAPEEEEEEDYLPKVTIVGRPNVGKSSLTNALLGTDRNIVTDIAGTTRDTIKIHYNQFGHECLQVGIAGICRKSEINGDIEFYSVMRPRRALENSYVVMFMLDANDSIEAQDINMVHLDKKNKKG